ncbi:hypothetical protein [Aliarcobacter butzleri]|uniref:hypothetical protein n=1 Tax=Aliarcobacter butzleri TaxID=28197 RepID=UPI00126A14D5|nr:hypothetical protein [Aliarcobacter butzleri]
MNIEQIATLNIKDLDNETIECFNEIKADLVPCNKQYYFFFAIDTIVDFLEENSDIKYNFIRDITAKCLMNNITMLLLK